jgi:hypothetical protein
LRGDNEMRKIKAWEMKNGVEYYCNGMVYKMIDGYLNINVEDEYWEVCSLSYNDVFTMEFTDYEDEY